MAENSKSTEAQNRIFDMISEDRPRERLLALGPQSLKDSELLAILLRTGLKGENVIDLSEKILREVGYLKGLKKVNIEQLSSIKGIGKAKACQVMAAIELGRRFSKIYEKDESQIITNANDVYEIVHYEMEDLDHEELWVINLNTRHNIIAIDKLYRGSINSSPVRVAEVFHMPIARSTLGIILVHNHPSGDPKPSAADIAITKNIFEAGKLLEIEMMDHIIIGKGKYISLKSLGIF